MILNWMGTFSETINDRLILQPKKASSIFFFVAAGAEQTPFQGGHVKPLPTVVADLQE